MSILNVNKINPVGGGSTVTIAGIASVTSSVTAPSFVGSVTGDVTGDVTGNVTGDATGLSGNPSINTTGIVTATSFVPTVGQLSHRNIIINGAMTVAQRGTSSTTSGYGSVDRFSTQNTGTDEAPTHAQVDVASGTTPYSLGFRKALRVTNGNQTGGAGTLDFITMRYKVEAQDIANSGWNYTSATSFVTMSFWCKSSVAQNFYGYLYSHDGTAQAYAFETGSLSANTWTKVVLKIPGNSNLQFDNNNDIGLDIYISQFWGTDRTDGGKNLNSWASYNGAARTRDFTSTWYTTNDATFELTGLQLEVGPVATPFEHLSYANQLRRCQRYYCRITPSNNAFYGVGNIDGGNQSQILVTFPTEMRGRPTSIETTGTPSNYILRVTSNVTCTSVPQLDICTTTNALVVPYANGHGFTDKSGAFLRANGDASFLGFSAEL